MVSRAPNTIILVAPAVAAFAHTMAVGGENSWAVVNWAEVVVRRCWVGKALKQYTVASDASVEVFLCQ